MLQKFDSQTKKLDFFEDDYQYASIDLLWHRKDQKRTLLFSLIQLWPQEFPEPEEINEDSKKINKNRGYFYHKRIIVPLETAIKWYENALSNTNLVLLKQQPKVLFEKDTYQQYIKWPSTILSKEIPFSLKHETVRYHGLFGIHGKLLLNNFILEDEYRKWINNKIMFDIFKYSEYFGSINIIAYNPLYRKIHQRLILDGEEKGNVFCEIEPRVNKDLSNLKMIVVSNSELGFFSFQEINISDNNFIIQYHGFIGAIGYYISCPDRGLLDYQEFLPFIKEIKINMGIISQRQQITIKDKKNNKIDTYKTQKVEYENISIKNDKYVDDNENLYRLFLDKNLERKLIEKEKNRGSKILYRNEQETKKYIRNIISKALKRVVFIDPYITTKEIFRFSLAVESKNTEIIIVTSNKVLNKKSNNSINGFKEKDILQKKIKQINKILLSSKFQIYVMSGATSIFHDRFIIVDDDLWIIGTSLNMVGKSKISLITKLDQPQELINFFTLEYKKMQTFEEWYKK